MNIDLPKLTDLKCTTGNFTNYKRAVIESNVIKVVFDHRCALYF